ncbi:MAG: SH3 domain-containing protein [Ardenticatenia bacterium]|nr:SH3 domain-containing protein [Ardenticatenia bacterium]
MSFDLDDESVLFEEPSDPGRRRRRGEHTGFWARLLLSLFVIGLAALVILVTVRNLGGEAPEVPPETPSLMEARFTPVIPTFTPGPTATPPEAFPVATATAPPARVPEALAVGVMAEVSAGGTGLNLREGPGLTFQVVELLPDGTRLEVADGPEEVDGYTWWRVRRLDTGREGWVAGEFLRPVPP